MWMAAPQTYGIFLFGDVRPSDCINLHSYEVICCGFQRFKRNHKRPHRPDRNVTSQQIEKVKQPRKPQTGEVNMHHKQKKAPQRAANSRPIEQHEENTVCRATGLSDGLCFYSSKESKRMMVVPGNGHGHRQLGHRVRTNLDSDPSQSSASDTEHYFP
ncbi:hypothetical protein F2P81_021949 [Scophthalmus maximus]|uniref:Uncharacterized protein n=1 Tax=Scophthalmus maximus TaxID=52904 RepID=A0A6A4RYT0_SCOMX|nr:hypothetical protein F2P81_021949 [Scophthalmus maximus]